MYRVICFKPVQDTVLVPSHQTNRNDRRSCDMPPRQLFKARRPPLVQLPRYRLSVMIRPCQKPFCFSVQYLTSAKPKTRPWRLVET